MPHSSGSGSSSCRCAYLGLAAWADITSREDTHCGFSGDKFLVLGLFLSRQASLSPQAEPRKARRPYSRTDSTQIGRFIGDDNPTHQPVCPRMVQFLPTLSLEHFSEVRRNGSSPPPPDSPQTPSSESQTSASSSSMDQCLLDGMWVVKPERGPHAFRSIHRNLLTGEPYAGEPPVRFGGRGVSNQWDVPTPYR